MHHSCLFLACKLQLICPVLLLLSLSRYVAHGLSQVDKNQQNGISNAILTSLSLLSLLLTLKIFSAYIYCFYI